MRLTEAVDTATVFPFLLYAHAELMPEGRPEFDRVLLVLESFLMRRLVTNWTSKNYNRLFVDLTKATQRSGPLTARSVAAYLGSGAGESTKFPSNEDLRYYLFDQPLYGRIAQYKVRAVLEVVDAASQTKLSPKLDDHKDLTIEHVMPQSWQAHWPLLPESTTDALSRQEAAERRKVLLNTLGNLTLITGNFNSKLQNAAWSKKRPALLKYMKINLTQYFHDSDAEVWNEYAIRERTEHLFHLLTKVWPEPSSVS